MWGNTRFHSEHGSEVHTADGSRKARVGDCRIFYPRFGGYFCCAFPIGSVRRGLGGRGNKISPLSAFGAPPAGQLLRYTMGFTAIFSLVFQALLPFLLDIILSLFGVGTG